MAKYTFVVLTNAVEGKDDAFDEWYTNTHLGEVQLAVPGFVSAQRFKLTDAQRAKPPHPVPISGALRNRDKRPTEDTR